MNDKNDFIDLSKYVVTSRIDGGSFGEVFKIKEKKTDQIYCAKVSLKTMSNNSEEDLRDLRREVNIMSKLNHPSVLKYIGFNQTSFTNENKPVIITEYVSNGTLANIIESERKSCAHSSWNETKKLINIYGIASAMSYLHKKQILHRDLKPANILMDDFLFPKVADFGLSKIKHDNLDSMTLQSTKEIKGTPIYISPEIWERSEYSLASDVYAFGIIVYEIVTNEEPFKGLKFYDIPVKVQNGYRPNISYSPSESYTQLIERCWAQNPADRLTFDEILQMLKDDSGFITDLIDEDDFIAYTQYIDNYQSSFDKNKKSIIPIDKFIKHESSTFKRVTVNYATKEEPVNSKAGTTKKSKTFHLFKKSGKVKLTYPINSFNDLDNECQSLVQDAEDDPEKMFNIGVNLIEGKQNFPQNIQIGILYLEKSTSSGCDDALIYYSRMLIEGTNIPQDLTKAKKLLKKPKKKGDASAQLLYGKLLKKQEDFKKANKYFESAAKAGNVEAMYEYGKMLLKGKGTNKNEKEAQKYFEIAKKNGFTKSSKYLPQQENESTEPKQKDKKVKQKAATMMPIKQSKPIKINLDSDDEDDINNFKPKIVSSSLYSTLNTSCKNIVKNAETSLKEKYLISVANGFLKGTNSFPKNQDTAIQYLEYEIKKKSVKSLELYGTELFKGKYLTKNEDKSVKLLTKAAEEFNSPEAKYQLSKIILSHQSFDINSNANNNVNYPLAKKYSKEAADFGHVKSMVLYGQLCYKEKSNKFGSIHRDFKESYKYLKKAADKGDGEGMAYLAKIIENGFGVLIPNSEEAFNYFKKSYEKGNLSGQANYGSFLIEGKFVTKNEKEGTRLIIQASEQNDIGGLNIYGYYLFNGSKYIPKDEVESYHFFKKAAKLGSSSAIRNVGICFKEGNPVNKNLDLAIKYLKLALEEGSIAAAYNIGILLIKGDKNDDSFKKNEKEGIKYLKLAADYDYGPALEDYSKHLRDQNRPEKEWLSVLERGLEIKDVDCICFYIALYLDNLITPKDKVKAAQLARFAADSGDKLSMEMYAEILQNGIGVPVNTKEANRYLEMTKAKE